MVSGDFAKSNFDSPVESARLDRRIKTKLGACGAHLSKTAKGGAASFVELSASCMGPFGKLRAGSSSGVARFACDSAFSG